ncbi:GNAT family N-acetyltransferase [Nitrospira sp. T9]|uniref:GNAT family N-acetyltransferase n=1 Tax=unclassified Nitrospira TaxID=2652172 RepID=UPI003F948AFA
MNIQVLKSSQDLDRLRPVWEELANASAAIPPWATYEWFSSWYHASSDTIFPYIILFFENGKVIGLAPLIRTVVRYYGVSFRQIGFVSDTTPNEVLISNSDTARCIAALIGHLSKIEQDWDVIKLRGLKKQSQVTEQLISSIEENGYKWHLDSSIESPYLPIRNSWEDFYKTLSRKMRASLRKDIKAIESEGGAINVIDYSTPGAVDGGLELVRSISKASWQSKEGTDLFSGRDGSFYQRFAKIAASRGWLQLRILFLRSQPIAFTYDVCFGKTVYGLKTGFDRNYQKFSPGKVLLRHILEDYFSRQFQEMNFMGAADAYKLNWTSLVCPYSNLWIYPDKVKSTVHSFLRREIVSRFRNFKALRTVARKIRRLKSGAGSTE